MIIFKGMDLGQDFTGGTVVKIGYSHPVKLTDIRTVLSEAGFSNSEVQHFGTSSDVVIRLAPREGLNSAQLSSQILQALQDQNSSAQMRRVEFVGPKVGDELFEQVGLALIYSIIGILIYVALRFEWRMAVGTIVALELGLKREDLLLKTKQESDEQPLRGFCRSTTDTDQ